MLNFHEPVIAGRVQEIDKMEQIVNHLMNDVMQRTLEEHKVMVTETPLNPKVKREEFIDLMFNEFKVPKLYMGNQSVLSLFATGRTTGTVVDSGDGITHTVPIYEGYALPFATTEIPICGRDLTKFMRVLLASKNKDKGQNLIEENEEGFEIAEKIKCLHGKVALDYDADIKAANDNQNAETTYRLPGGQIISLREERLKAAEVLFTPTYDSNLKVEDGIHKFTYDAIIKCDRDIQKDLFHNIVLAGGGTMFKGMQDRMTKEIQALAASPMKPEVEAPADRKHSAWLGGAILS